MTNTSFLRLLYGSGKVIEPFLARLYGESHPKIVYWISPWLTHVTFPSGSTRRLLRKLQAKRTHLIVITREPESGSRHEEFIRDVSELGSASIFFMPMLHAKFYITATNERRYALLGSANMYEWKNRAYEVGVVIDAKGDGEVLVDKLEQLALELRLMKNTRKI